MSIEDVQAIVDIAVKPHAKTQNRLVMALIVVIMIPIVLLGIDIGNWSKWREDISTWKSGIEMIVKDHEKSINQLEIKQDYLITQKSKTK